MRPAALVLVAAALAAAPVPKAPALLITDVDSDLSLRPNAARVHEVCRLDADDGPQQAAASKLRKEHAAAFDGKDWVNLGPDSSFEEIVFALGGKRLTLRSWHPVVERDPKAVAASFGVIALNGRAREEVLASGDPVYLKKRRAFDAVVSGCLAARRPAPR